MNFYRDYGKRLVDLALAVPALVVLAKDPGALADAMAWMVAHGDLWGWGMRPES